MILARKGTNNVGGYSIHLIKLCSVVLHFKSLRLKAKTFVSCRFYTVLSSDVLQLMQMVP